MRAQSCDVVPDNSLIPRLSKPFLQVLEISAVETKDALAIMSKIFSSLICDVVGEHLTFCSPLFYTHHSSRFFVKP